MEHRWFGYIPNSKYRKSKHKSMFYTSTCPRRYAKLQPANKNPNIKYFQGIEIQNTSPNGDNKIIKQKNKGTRRNQKSRESKSMII